MSDILGWFQSQPEALQPAILSAATAFSLFILGFLTIAGTAWANRRNTLKAARDQQKLEIFREMLVVIHAARDAQLAADGYLRGVAAAIRFHADLHQNGLPASPPRQRWPEFSRLHAEQLERASEIHIRLEDWALIDHRLEAFRKAFGFQVHSVLNAETALSPILMRLLPTDRPEGGTFPYEAPQDPHLAEFKAVAEAYHRESGLLGCYIGDLVVELQPLLLGHLFGTRIVRRDPPDPTQFTIRLDRYKEIIRYFEGTEHFRRGAQLDRELRAQYGNQPTLWRRLQWWRQP